MLLSAAAFFLAVTAQDSTRPISQLIHTQWSANDGAPRGARALAQTTDGYLWIGGTVGLYRFDGVRFVQSIPPDSILRQQSIRRLIASPHGGLWILWTSGAVGRLRDGRWTIWHEADGLPSAMDL